MPMLIPVAVAAFEAYGAVTAIAEVGLTVASGLELAGAALSVAGAVTGNKTLSMIGGIAGLGGGLANLASNAGGLTVDAAGEGMDAGSHGFNAAADTGIAAPATDAAAGTAGGAAATDSFAAITPQSGEVGQGLVAGENPQLLSSATDVPTVNAPDTAAAPAAGAAPAAPSAPQYAAPGVNDAANAGPDYGSATGPGAPGTSGGSPLPDQQLSSGPGNQSWSAQVGDVLKGGVKLAHDNPELTKMASGVIQGGMNYYGNQQLAESNLARAKNYQDWVRQRYSDSVKNLSTPGVQVTKGPSSGIIAGARS